MGITVDFAARMVHGFEFPVPIIDVNEMTIIMAGASQTIRGIKIFGIIDRVTGEINVIALPASAISCSRTSAHERRRLGDRAHGQPHDHAGAQTRSRG